MPCATRLSASATYTRVDLRYRRSVGKGVAGMRFLHTADWQLGMTRHFLAGEAQPRYSAARRDAVAGLGALAAEVGRRVRRGRR